MELDIFQVDAFASELFRGNPAAVVPLEKWLDDDLMQNIAAENNLSETAFFIKDGNNYRIRWMTPTSEVPLCGHATLATSFVIFNFFEKEANVLNFISKSGPLSVLKEKDLLVLDFPSNKPQPVKMPEGIIKCFGKEPVESLESSSFLLLIFDDEEFIRNYIPDIEAIKKFHKHGVIISSRGKEVDFVSRVFVPNEGINEDPVTGSAHTVLTPYWSEKLNKKLLTAYQVSKRGGKLICENSGERTKIKGNAVLYLKGKIYL
ncbi:PhzF family phenazine biosynthesis protein [Melioribacter sp. OK-6-Me]|uniref:PhzF family phenazine biosynthesis protein n=1 Tax=unclassified Melioribacter TaxID=2627329 RepID=UPI003EDB0533